MGPWLRRPAGFAVGWLAATCAAVVIGLAVVTTLGGSLRGRGPLGDESAADRVPAGPPGASDLATAQPGERRTFEGG